MSNNSQKSTEVKFRPLLWIMAGCIMILLPIFIFWTTDNLNRQKRAIDQLLTDKGQIFILNIEMGARLGQIPLQRSVTFFAESPDISYILLTDLEGNITNHNDPDQIGKKYGNDIEIPSLLQPGKLINRKTNSKDGNKIFEVYRVFIPRLKPRISRGGPPPPPPQRNRRLLLQKNPNYPEEGSRIIFVGLDMSHIEAQSKEDTREVIKRGFYLLLIGFAGISLFILFQAYRTAQSSLSRIKAFSDNIVENMPIGLVVLDTDSIIASFNYTAETLLHISGKNIVGKSVEQNLPDQFTKLTKELRQNKRNIVKELEVDLGEHGKVYLDMNLSILEDNSGHLLGYIILFRDLSEVQALKKEVERSTRLAAIGRLAAGVAHEIRNPLSSIKGFATYFGERYKDIPEDRDTAQIMVNEVERLNRVISQLLEFARPVNINKEIIDIKTVINHSTKMIERDANEKNISTKVEIPLNIPHIAVDSDRINQVFLNLFLNSIESMDYGGELSVIVDYDYSNEMMKITISDTGKGIASNDIGNIFDPYFTTKQSGTGLGLAIVHSIIESHNGEIKVKSHLEKGTDIIIRLPLN